MAVLVQFVSYSLVFPSSTPNPVVVSGLVCILPVFNHFTGVHGNRSERAVMSHVSHYFFLNYVVSLSLFEYVRTKITNITGTLYWTLGLQTGLHFFSTIYLELHICAYFSNTERDMIISLLMECSYKQIEPNEFWFSSFFSTRGSGSFFYLSIVNTCKQTYSLLCRW